MGTLSSKSADSTGEGGSQHHTVAFWNRNEGPEEEGGGVSLSEERVCFPSQELTARVLFFFFPPANSSTALANETLLSKERTRHTLGPPAAHPVEHVCPALHGDALKHGEHGKGKVIEVGDASVWANPATPALRAIGGTLASIP